MSLVEANSFPPANRPSMSTVSLTRLVDFTIQRTYNELIILADLLPRKSDIERKIEIVNFANRTRQLFIRLYALVKWAGNASKVEKCSTIVAFLDKQAMLFVETADVLAKMARESLVQARLPTLQLPVAVEVLTLGTYSRLPTCIRERIVPPDSISTTERKTTLQRLNQIIQQRLVGSNLSWQMTNFRIENGRVIFHVNHEFEMALTLMGDGQNIPWRVLSIDFLVEDKETGEGKDLVHPLQTNYLLNLIQSRLNDNSKSLMDPYNVLHAFCLSLQLEVLQAQAVRLSRERLGDLIRVEEYVPGRRLSISYWRHQDESRIENKVESTPPCRLTIEIDSHDTSKSLQVTHFPELNLEATASANEAIKSDHLSIEKLLIHTTHERAKQELSDLQLRIIEAQLGTCTLSGSPPLLQVSLLKECLPSEKLLITNDPFNGHILGHIPQFDETPLTDELQSILKKDVSKWRPFFQKLKVLIYRERLKKTSELLPVFLHEKLPFISSNIPELLKESLNLKLFVQFCRHPKNFLLITLSTNAEEKADQDPAFSYYLLSVESTALGNVENQPQFEMELPKVYAKLNSLIELDVQSIIGTSRRGNYEFRKISAADYPGKRKLNNAYEPSKKPKISSFFMPEFAYLVSFCEEKLVFGALSAELDKRGICHHVRASDEPGYAHYVDIIQFPPDSFGLPSKLRSNLISCTIRLQGKGTLKLWMVLLTFYNNPQLSQALKENNLRKVVSLMYDFSSGSQSLIVQMVNDLLLDWTAISKLYDVVSDFVEQPNLGNYFSTIEVRSLTYKKLTIGYGPLKNFIVSIHWKSVEKRYQLSFGLGGLTTSNSNPHTIVSSQLQHEFNQHRSITLLTQTLNVTLGPLLTLQGLTSVPLLGSVNSRPQVPVQTFCIVPQSSTHIRLIYRNTYCVDIVFSLDGLIAIRDGAFSLFDKAKVLEELSPIQGLKAFLGKFVDRNATQMRRLSQTEDDNPPSPISHMESVESYLFQANSQNQVSSPMGNMHSSGDASGSMISPVGAPGMGPNPNVRLRQAMTPGSLVSHPNTPASPHNSILSQNTFASSPNTSFPLASPPSHGAYPGPGSAGQIVLSPSIPNVSSHPEQSPGNLFGVNSPMNPLHAQSPSFLPIPSPSAPNTNIHSPASNYMSSQQSVNQPHDHPVNSPYPSAGTSNMSMQSPASVPWPNSPSMPRPSPSRPLSSGPSPVAAGLGTSPQTNVSHYHFSIQPGHMPMSSARFLPQRSWAAAIPTLLTHLGFDNMCKPNAPLESPQAPHHNSVYASLSQLERFLGCVFMRKTLQRVLGNEVGFQVITNNPAPGIIQFKNDTLQFKIAVHPITMQSLQIDIRPCPEHENSWMQEQLDILKRFFETKVVCAPYKPNPFIAYARLLNAPPRIVKDCIQIMKLEMFPDPSLKWNVQWALTIPPTQVTLSKPGMSAILLHKNTTMLFFLIFTRANLPVNIEPQTIVVPFIFDANRNFLQIATSRENGPTIPVFGVINEILKSYNEYNSMQSAECPIFQAIREICVNDLVPPNVQ